MNSKVNFLIIGANKGGTTSFFKYLGEHPEVFEPEIKEPMFFNYYQKNGEDGSFRTQKVIKTLKSYENLFIRGIDFKMRGESSTSYLANPYCADNIYDYNPNMKLIVFLRNPIERAFSNYLMYVRWNDEKRSFSQALKDEINGVDLPQGKQYIYLGHYLKSLKIYEKKFSKKQLKIVLFEDLKDDVNKTYKDICEYLDIDKNFTPNFNKKYNTNDLVEIRPFYKLLKKIIKITKITRFLPKRLKRSIFKKPKISYKEKTLLKNIYNNEINELSVFINRDLSSWLK